jgi:hypothetical protein
MSRPPHSLWFGYTKHTNKTCGQNSGLLIAKPRGTHRQFTLGLEKLKQGIPRSAQWLSTCQGLCSAALGAGNELNLHLSVC